ncbi:MAG TPA: hypothetical protein GX506_07280 [Firmicutes bacterium]|nr:hypothetical protein [Bacillota bacterium]
MSYDLDTVYVLSLGLLVGIITVPFRDWAERRLAAWGVRLHSFLWGWVAMACGMLLTVPVLLAKGVTPGWRLIVAAYTEGLPVGAVAIVAYDLGIKPAKRFGRFIIKTIGKWILSSMERGGMYSAYGYGSGPDGLGEEELEDDPSGGLVSGHDVVNGGKSNSTPAGAP